MEASIVEKIRINAKEIREVSPILKGIMNLAFDESCIMDKDGYIVHCSDSSPLIWGRPNEESIGMHISELDSASPYPELLKTGKAVLGKVHIINGKACITHMIPLFNFDDEIVGAFGVIIFRGMEKVKKIVRETPLDSTWEEMYHELSRAEAKYSLLDFVGRSQLTREVLSLAKRVAKFDYPILIRGETGCGKEIIAGGIHVESNRNSSQPFIRINCTAIPHDLLESELFGHEKGAFTGAYSTKQGKFELAAHGTVLLDEIGELNAAMQAKLLRVLEEREFERIGGNRLIPFHARVIASTNSCLEQQMKKGAFREDLYYRLSGIEIKVPPLRERKEDIMLLIEHFITQQNLECTFTNRAVEFMYAYQWPGNVRELRNMVFKLSVLEKTVIDDKTVRELLNIENYAQESPAEINTNKNLVWNSERNLIIQAMGETRTLTEAAQYLGISRSSLYSKLNKLGIDLKRQPVCRY